jgi:hypothetical protein
MGFFFDATDSNGHLVATILATNDLFAGYELEL